MLNLIKVFNKTFISKFNFNYIPLIKVICSFDADIEKIVKNHGGIAFYTKDKIYKTICNKHAIHFYQNQNNFSSRNDGKHLIKTLCLYMSSNTVVTQEKRIIGLVDNSFTFNDISKIYGLITEDKIFKEKINIRKFIDKNFSLLQDSKYQNKIEFLLSNINREVNLSLIHGDFWSENILQTKDKLYFIDYDRSCEYSFFEFDLVNYFVFSYVYKDNKPSWLIFVKYMEKLLCDSNLCLKLKSFIDNFCKINDINNINTVYFDEIIKLYIIKIIYNNNLSLEGVNYLKWYRYRSRIEKLLWD